jgi:hypothetical protein
MRRPPGGRKITIFSDTRGTVGAVNNRCRNGDYADGLCGVSGDFHTPGGSRIVNETKRDLAQEEDSQWKRSMSSFGAIGSLEPWIWFSRSVSRELLAIKNVLEFGSVEGLAGSRCPICLPSTCRH